MPSSSSTATGTTGRERGARVVIGGEAGDSARIMDFLASHRMKPKAARVKENLDAADDIVQMRKRKLELELELEKLEEDIKTSTGNRRRQELEEAKLIADTERAKTETEKAKADTEHAKVATEKMTLEMAIIRKQLGEH